MRATKLILWTKFYLHRTKQIIFQLCHADFMKSRGIFLQKCNRGHFSEFFFAKNRNFDQFSSNGLTNTAVFNIQSHDSSRSTVTGRVSNQKQKVDEPKIHQSYN